MSTPILAIDIGSTKICAIIGKKEDGKVEISGHGIAKSQGIKKGTITNIEQASKAIKRAVDDAKRVSGLNITTATISISAAYTKSINSTGVVNIPNNDISINEINRVMQTALYNANIPNEFEILHVLPYKFKIDEQDYIEDPYGMNASRMEVDTHIIMTAKSSLENLKKAVNAANIEIGKVVLSGYASSLAVINQDDRERGVAVIDLGGQTSNLVIHVGNAIQYNDFLSVGSNHITNDLSIALHTPFDTAEKLKIAKGSLLTTGTNENIELPIIGDEHNLNTVSMDIVHSIIHSRMEEALTILANSIANSGLKNQIGAGIMLTGGMTHIEGTRELAQALMPNIPIRIGSPPYINKISNELLSAEYSVAVGLMLYEAGYNTEYELERNKQMLHSKEYIPKDSLSDIASITGIKPKIHVSEPSFEEKEASELFADLSREPVKDNNNPVQSFVEWAKKIF
ncbi:cell division protein FtsA [Sulfurovum sp. bin170]|uniref:cell division protein FtsA n=1 Tax=Sulfurovum sp. bin170 TaxID=2695268 RepID=UPI0013E09B62|nr:cell division protein FtsA [Sulfurovum sp. bin170]NEW60611.1 cell division protein FtsA [Sulfurovum sp. bin170]